MANQTSLQIKSMSNDKTNTTTIQYVNPEATNAQLVQLAQKIIALTTDTYSGVYKITKEVIG